MAPGALESLLRCPRCGSALIWPAAEKSTAIACANRSCIYSEQQFPVVGGQPVLVDFERSIFSREDILGRQGESPIARDHRRAGFASRIKDLLLGRNEAAARCSAKMCGLLKAESGASRVLVIGGGAIGSGANALYGDAAIAVVGIDVYCSPYTAVVADGHFLPFADGAFDGVWIQAVLEHVLCPQDVVDQIHRVLRPGGIVFADTPFMQQVHEGAWDFTRFTASGHRWLFRAFGEIESGTVGGPGMAAIWSIRYLVRALTRSDKLATALSLLFFWLRFADRFCGRREAADGATGVYFLGRRSAQAIGPKAMVGYYAAQAIKQPAGQEPG
jgi:SAM-dependent methyltransferase